MNIRTKFVLTVLPLILTPLILMGISSSLSARNGITRVATEFLRFKAEELEKYAESQWSFLVDSRLASNPEFVESAKAAVESFAKSIVHRETELIIALDKNGETALTTGDLIANQREKEIITQKASSGSREWLEIEINGVPRVAASFRFEPFQWYFLVSERHDTFYQPINQIYRYTGIISISGLVLVIAFLLLFASYLTRPMRNVVEAMRETITKSDFSRKVPILYRDETGELAHTFNLMVSELGKTYNQIKGYALKAAVARTKEQRIRSIFQRYVPEDVIDEFFNDPDSMLIGKKRVVAVLFSDIRSFTTISEAMNPHEVVDSLNAYFSIMVDIIVDHRGIVDKYIGDSIMAVYGVPTSHGDDAVQAVHSALEMFDALRDFNRWQLKREKPEFHIGIGINYGPVTVGNIGSEKKMDYTVVGNMVNLASRLESLTKVYRENLLISESTYRYVANEVKARMVDRVVVKGKSKSVGIYTVRKKLEPEVEKAWELHEKALNHYYAREFRKAAAYFRNILNELPYDRPSKILLRRCMRYIDSPPPSQWDGVIQIEVK
jgi:class 3 adenylate cyclase/HAMP domain-containing protein